MTASRVAARPDRGGGLAATGRAHRTGRGMARPGSRCGVNVLVKIGCMIAGRADSVHDMDQATWTSCGGNEYTARSDPGVGHVGARTRLASGVGAEDPDGGCSEFREANGTRCGMKPWN